MNNQTNTSGRETADERLERYAKESNNAAAIMKRNRETSERLSKETGHDVDFYEDGIAFYYRVEPKEDPEPDFGYRVSVTDVNTGQSHIDWGIVFNTKERAIHYANTRANEGYRCRVARATSQDVHNWNVEQAYRNAPPARKLLRKSKELIDKSVTWIFAIITVTLFICAVIMATQEVKAQEVVCAYGTIGCITRYSSPSIDTTPQYNITPPSQLYGPSLDGNADDFFGTPGLKPLNEVHDDWCRSDPDYYGC